MIKNIYFLLPIILISGWSEVFSQREDYNWMLGRCSPLSDSLFSRIHWTFKDTGTYLEHRAYKVSHILDYTNASISDSLGQLLFYTNGLSVYNRNYELMPNGEGLNPGRYANSSKDSGYKLEGGALILPWPEHPHKFFIFHLTTDNIPFVWYSLNLFTTLVDLDLHNGNGDVVYKNHSVFTDSLCNGILTACRHANGRDWWIPCFYYSGKKCFVFLLDTLGISLHHIQDIPFKFELSGRGQAHFSPDGSKYAFFRANSYSYREFFFAEFNRCTGLFSNMQLDTVPLFHWCGVAFSPNSQFLYLATGTELYQLNVNNSTPFKSRVKIDSIDGFQSFPLFPSYFSLMQLAPDNKIYINNGTAPDYLSAIEKPDLDGKSCDVRQHNIHITSNSTLPNFPYFRLGAMEGSTCDTLARGRLPVADWTDKQDSVNPLLFNFTDHSLYEVREWSWDFGDPLSIDNSSNLQNPSHQFSKHGDFDICLIAKNKNGADTFCRTIRIETVSSWNNSNNNTITLSPNPFEDILNIGIAIYETNAFSLEIYNSIGKKLMIEKIQNGNNQIDLKALSSGVYFISIFAKGAIINTHKLVKI